MATGSVVRIMCPNLRCRAVLAVPPEARGRLVRCRNCGMNIKIPTKSEPVKARRGKAERVKAEPVPEEGTEETRKVG